MLQQKISSNSSSNTSFSDGERKISGAWWFLKIYICGDPRYNKIKRDVSRVWQDVKSRELFKVKRFPSNVRFYNEKKSFSRNSKRERPTRGQASSCWLEMHTQAFTGHRCVCVCVFKYLWEVKLSRFFGINNNTHTFTQLLSTCCASVCVAASHLFI